MQRTSSSTLSSLGSVAILACAIFAFAAAHADPKPAAEARTVAAFHGVELAGTLQVEIEVGKPAGVTVTGEADLLDKVVTTVNDGVLVLDTKRDLPRKHHLRAVVTTPELTSIGISGTGDMHVAGIAGDSLAVRVPGTGALTLAGQASTLRLSVDGTGNIAAKNLATKVATVDMSGTGSATLQVSQSLDAKISGTGSIDVHGHPAQVRKSVTGVGNVHVH